MSEQYLLGVDIGTSGSTGVLVDPALNVVESVALEHDVSVPTPGWAEHDADEVWWNDFVQITQRLFERTDVEPDDVAGVGVSALHAAMLPLDESGTPLRPAILYGVDTRSGEEIALLNERIGRETIYQSCGNALTFQSVGPKILWYKRNEPERFDRTEQIVDATGYVVYKLTGEYTMDNAIAAFFHPLYNPSELTWNDEMFDATGLDRGLLPETRWSTEIAGAVTGEAAAETGLAEGTPVIVGTGDALASQISVGAVEPGDAIFMYGTTGVIYTVLDEERTTPELWSFPHCLEGKYTIAGGMATSGAIVKWFRNEFGGDAVVGEGTGKASYSHLNDEAADLPPGSDGLVVLPYFSGERTPINDDAARGTVTGLTLSHTKYHVYRAILEGVGYGFRHHLETMRAAGVPIDRVLAIGGGAQSDLWRQIVSDVTGVSQQYVSNPVGSPLGGAYLAGLGTDVFDGLDPLTESTTVAETTEWDAETKETYDEYYEVYRDLYPSIKEDMHRLAALGSE
jgi:xylulokinase